MFLWYIFSKMKKILWVLIVFYAFLPVNGQQKAAQPDAGKDTTESKANPSPPITVTVINENVSKDEEQHSKANPQGYFGQLIAPNNLPNVLLVAVGIGAIVFAWKTVHATKEAAEATRDAAEATRDAAEASKKALIYQFRPKIVIRDVRLAEPEEVLTIEFQVVNRGSTPANIQPSSITAEWLYSSDKVAEHITTATFRPLRLEAGEQEIFQIPFEDSRVVLEIAKLYLKDQTGQYMFLRCTGEIVYADENGTKRRTGFRRTYDLETKRFSADPNPENEYED